MQKKVRSLAVDKDSHRVCAPEQEVDGRPAARMTVYEAVTGQAATYGEFRSFESGRRFRQSIFWGKT